GRARPGGALQIDPGFADRKINQLVGVGKSAGNARSRGALCPRPNTIKEFFWRYLNAGIKRRGYVHSRRFAVLLPPRNIVRADSIHVTSIGRGNGRAGATTVAWDHFKLEMQSGNL